MTYPWSKLRVSRVKLPGARSGGQPVKRIAALGLMLAFVASPALAQDKSFEDKRAEDEAFVQKLLEILQKTAEQADSQDLDRTPYDNLADTDNEAAETIVRHLDNQRISLNFDDTSFADAVDFLRDATGLNIVYSRAAKEIIENAPKLKLRLKDIKVRNALELMLTQTDANLRYGVRNGVLEIGTQDDWKGRSLVLDLIPINDLVYRPPDFPAPEAGLDALTKNKMKGK